MACVEVAIGDGVIGSTMTHTGSSKIEVLFDTELHGDVIYRRLGGT